MYDISLIDETFDLNLSSTYHLSIQVGRKSFTYCILDSINNKYNAIIHYYFGEDIPTDALIETVKELTKGEEILTKRYKSVNIVFVTNKSTLIPKPLFNKNDIETYFKLNHTLEDNEEIMYNQFKNVDAYLVFTGYKELKSHFSQCFPGSKYFHQGNTLIDINLIEYKNKLNEPRVFLNLSNDIFDIVILENNKLVFFNSFLFKDDTDFNYYLINIFEQLKLNPETVELVLSGEINKTSSKYSNIKEYIKVK